MVKNQKKMRILWSHKKAYSEIEIKLYYPGSLITEIFIEGVPFLKEGHLSESEIRKCINKILKDANLDPDGWQNYAKNYEYDGWNRFQFYLRNKVGNIYVNKY